MENKITKTRLKTFFTYDFIKVVAVCILMCFVFSLLYNVVEKKPTEGQRFTVLYANDVLLGDDSDSVLYTISNSENEKGLSYDVLLLEKKQMALGTYSKEYVLNTFADVGDDDIFICTDTLVNTYIQSYYAEDLDNYVQSALDYLYDNGFYLENGEINEEKIISSFTSKYKKDARFKKQEDFEKGKQLEINRIRTIYKNASLLKRVFEDNPEIFYDSDSSGVTIKGRFAIDLGKLSGGEKNLVNSFYKTIIDEQTKEPINTAQGIYLLVGNNKNINGDLHYEGLSYVVSTLETYSNLI